MSQVVYLNPLLLAGGKREQTKVANRQSILDAAREVFGELGYETATVRDIIRRTGLAAGTFYNYYRSKEEVFTALADDGARRFAPVIKGLRGRGLTFEEFVQAAISAYFGFIAEEQRTWIERRPAGEPHPHVQGETPEMAAVFAEIRDALADDISQRKGPFADPDYMAAACIAIARDVGDKMLERRPVDTKGATEFAVTMILGGLKGLPPGPGLTMPSPDTQRMVVRTLLSLPTPMLRLMAGGGVVYQGGRTLDPRLQYLAAQGRGAPPMATLSPEDARRGGAVTLGLVSGPLEPGVRFETLSIEGPGGQIPARLYRPEIQDPNAPLMVFAHFGGGVIGDLDTCHAFCSILAKTARGPVLSVDYRLAPEHRFPAGLDDVMAAYRWGRDNAERFGAPLAQAAIGGDSMGGNFAAVVCQELKKQGEPQPTLQLLIYPWVDVACESASMTTYGDAFPLSRATLDWFAGHYMGPGDSPADPRLSPLRAQDLTGLAPAVIVTAGFDPLLDQGEAYARRLKEAGVPVIYRCYDSLAHAFTAFTGAIPCADVACREVAGLVREGFEGRIA